LRLILFVGETQVKFPECGKSMPAPMAMASQGVFSRAHTPNESCLARKRFTSAARKAKALRKLGVSADQVASATKITPLLRAGGGLKAVLGAMRFSQDVVVKCGSCTHLEFWAEFQLAGPVHPF
jgi:hypothetical protein